MQLGGADEGLDIAAVGRVGVDDVDVELGVVEAGGEGKGRRGGRRRERKEEKEKGREWAPWMNFEKEMDKF